MSGAGPAIGVALLGAGAGAEAHAAALAGLPGVRLAVVADPDGGRARALAGRHGAPAADDPEAALARDDVAVACLAAPNHRHLALAEAAAGRGRAVLVEKPLGRDAAEARAIVAACARHRVPLGLVLQNRFSDAARALRAELAGGALGRLVGATVLVRDHRDAGYFASGPWRGRRDGAGGGVLRIQAVHFLDLLEWLAGPVRAVTAARATRHHAVEVEDVMAATLELGDGAPAALFATTAASPESPSRLELLGTRGSAVLLEARGTVRLWRGAGGPAALRELARLESEMAELLAAPWPAGIVVEPHRRLWADFLDAVHTGRPPSIGGPDGVRIQAVMDAIYLAAREGRRTAIPDPGDAGLAGGRPVTP
jgi:UDP-N-acetyl-2-amino-2-deoxyglucuronate dehydrogenase